MTQTNRLWQLSDGIQELENAAREADRARDRQHPRR